MADSLITNLTEETSPAGTEEVAINDSGTDKKITLTNISTYTKNQLSAYITDAMIAGSGITTRSKLPAATAFIDEAHVWSEQQDYYDTKLKIVKSTDTSAFIQFLLSGMATGAELTISSSQSTDQTLTIPNITATDQITTLLATQTLQNKTLPDTLTTIGATSDLTKAVKFSLSGMTASRTLTIGSSQSTNQTLTLPNITGAATALTTDGVVSNSTPSNPTGTTNTSGLMMGLAGSITPKHSTRVVIMVSGMMANGTNGSGATVALRYGTGTAPTNGAALTGTEVGAAMTYAAATGNERSGFSLSQAITGLTPGTAYWIDTRLAAVTNGTASIYNVNIVAYEI